jgi:hypothetical protein
MHTMSRHALSDADSPRCRNPLFRPIDDHEHRPATLRADKIHRTTAHEPDERASYNPLSQHL